MTTEKNLTIDDALYKLFSIQRYQDGIISCFYESNFVLGELKKILQDFPRGFTLSELNDILKDFSRDFQPCIEKITPLLDVAYKLEDWAIGHHQVIQELCAILKQIEENQNQKMGGRE